MKAIIFMYDGRELSTSIIEAMCKYIAQCGRTPLTVDTLSDNDITEAIAAKAKQACVIKMELETPDSPQQRNAEEQAVIVIGTTMRDELEHFNPLAFGAAIIEKVNRAKKNPNRETNRAFMNALFVLSQEDVNISQSLLDEYNMDSHKISIIKSIYTTMLAH